MGPPTTTTTSPPSDPDCPFCTIATSSPPAKSTLPIPPPPPSPSSPPYIILSTPSLLAFLDHAPMSRGHTLVCIRAHRTKLSDLTLQESAVVGMWLPLIARSVMRAVRTSPPPLTTTSTTAEDVHDGNEQEVDDTEEEEEEIGDFNIVQNNGPRAAQVVPHVHFHIIPRVGGQLPELKARSWTMFGRGLREELDEGEAEGLVRGIRGGLRGEVGKLGRGELEGLFAGGGGEGEGEGEGDGGDWEGRWSKL